MLSLFKLGSTKNVDQKHERISRNFGLPKDTYESYESHDSRKRSDRFNTHPMNNHATNLSRHISNSKEQNRHRTTEKAPKTFNKFEAEKIEFLKEFAMQYGYNGKIDSIRENEYPQLKGAVYLDHSGATTYAKSILTSYHSDLTRNLFGNPHSNNPSSSLTSHRVEQVRLRILQHFDANPEDYQVIFTPNATGAIKVAGEMFPWTNKTKFMYLRESHNSLVGLRRYAEEFGSRITDSVDENRKKLNTNKSKYLVLLDAAAFLTSSMVSLADKENSPDFVVMSFYKIFGFPTGLGALIVKSELAPILKKRYFGGGTIQAVAYDRPWQKFRTDLSERYEDGTINFLDIISLQHAFTVTERIYTSFRLIKPHVTSLITYLDRRMRALKHWNGMPVVAIHSDHDYSDNVRQGPVFNFNVRKPDGNWVGYGEVEKMASVNGIHLRSGGLCNPGCVSRWVDLSPDDVIHNYKLGKICGDDKYIFNNKIQGAIRISLGAMTTIDDILTWLHFFQSYYVETASPELVPEKHTTPKTQFYKQDTYNSQIELKGSRTVIKSKKPNVSSPNLLLQLHEDMVLKSQQQEKLLGDNRKQYRPTANASGIIEHFCRLANDNETNNLTSRQALEIRGAEVNFQD
ncbi:15397_t:CDS:2 [Acaulospora morrowiae]|uniref:15397_t:CDS:1 n=1 Tax=Acaulospora morrowiae TaxID=94023 RepID=A0A9N8ZRS7_9GLOM|nr:15397_t:CDS:2 [Acaulospora morrowiae]